MLIPRPMISVPRGRAAGDPVPRLGDHDRAGAVRLGGGHLPRQRALRGLQVLPGGAARERRDPHR